MRQITTCFQIRVFKYPTVDIQKGIFFSSLEVHIFMGFISNFSVYLQVINGDHSPTNEGPPGFTCWISFAQVFSFIYCRVIIFALSPCYILIYMF